jgi:hypothetical protein
MAPNTPNIIIRTTDEITQSRGVKVLVHAGTGVGKTRMCATAPDPFIISAEHGLLSLKKFRIPATEIRSMADLGNVYLWLMESSESRFIQTVCIDSWSDIAEVFLEELRKIVKDPRQAYFETQLRILEMTRYFRDIPDKNVYITAKSGYEKDELSGAMKWGPMMPGNKLAQLLPFLFDEVWALRTSSAKDPVTGIPYRYVQTQEDLQYLAKDRSGSLAFQEPADLTHLFNKMRA